MYNNGDGVPTDKSKAVQWFQKAADQGYANAQHNLGIMYYNGEGVLTDKSKAAQWYQKAADQGMADAQTKLGEIYYNGEGVPMDKSKAAQWCQKAADQGYAAAQFDLGVMYYSSILKKFIDLNVFNELGIIYNQVARQKINEWKNVIRKYWDSLTNLFDYLNIKNYK
jgi:TPR repeat protein